MASPLDSIRGAKKPSFSTRVGKHLRRPKRRALYTVFHTRAQPNNPPIVTLKTRPRQRKKTSFQLKKWFHNGFQLLHFTAPVVTTVPGNTGGYLRKFITLQERMVVRTRAVKLEIKRRQSWKFRKQAKFTQWHTGITTAATGAALIPRLQTRVRRTRKLASFQIRKNATFPVSNAGTGFSPRINPFVTHKRSVRKPSFQAKKWAHYKLFELGVGGPTGAPAVPFIVQTTKFKTRVQRKKQTRPITKKAARFGKVFNTGSQFVAQPQTFTVKTHKRKVAKTVPFRQKKFAKFRVFNTGQTAATSRQVASVKTRKRSVAKVRRNRAGFSLFHFTAPIIVAVTNQVDAEIHIFKLAFDNKMHKL